MSVDIQPSNVPTGAMGAEQLDGNDVLSFQKNQLDTLRSNLEQGESAYVEIHETSKDEAPIVLVSPIPPREQQYASTDGSHSIADEIRNFPSAHTEFMKFIDDPKHHLDIGSLSAKGVIEKDGSDKLMLALEHVRSHNEDELWSDLYELAPKIGLDNLARRSRGMLMPLEIDPVMHETATVVDIDMIPSQQIPEHLRTNDYIVGVLSKVDVAKSRLARDDTSDEYHQETALRLKLADAKAKIHDPVYAATGLEYPTGCQDIMWRGHPMKVGLRYAIDRSKEHASQINIFFDAEKNPTQDNQDLAKILARACARAYYDDADAFDVTISFDKKPASIEYKYQQERN
jgi:hypothetical protein